ncbi:MAG TPA: PAS domain S-box protein [Bryobacteraceae bacterium]|nr:PAS domain S-box protein [Bryobacteraceae bacterium]
MAANWWHMRVLSKVWRYGLAVVSCGLALALAIPLDSPSSCFFLAVMVSSLYGGKGPGVLSVLLSSLAFDYFFLPPKYSFTMQPFSSLQFTAFLGAVLVVSVLIEAKRRAEEASRQIDAKYRQVSDDALAQAQKSEAQLRLMINSIPVPAWSSRADGATDFVNQRWLDYTGIAPEQALGWGWKVVCHPDDLDRTMEYWRSVLASHEDRELEARLRRFDGTYRWFLFRVSPLRDDSGKVVKWYGTCIDIEDRKTAADAVRASELQFRMIVHSIPGLVATMTPQGDLELVNQPVLDYTGLAFDALKDWWATGLVPEEELPLVTAKWKQSVETGCEYDVEHHMRRADGAYRWFHVRGLPLRDTHGQVVRWYCVLTDIEGRKRTEEALRSSEHHLRLITETIPALVWRTTPDGEIDYVNRRVLEYTGKPLEHFGKDGWLQLLHPDDVDSTIRLWRQNIQTGHSHRVAYRLRRADGTYRWFDVRGEPLRDIEGRVVQWYGICIDVEDRKRTEEALRYTQERLSIASQVATVGELSASIAHEVNQPLTAVVSNGNACLRWLSAQPPNLAKAVEAAQRIVRDGKDAGEVVRRIRALFKRAAHEEVSLDLNEVIGEVLGLLRGETAKRRVIVQTDLGQNLPPVTGDRLQLQQLILNLLLNGIEAMDPVTDHPKRLFIRSTQEPDDTVLVEIRDSGVGLKDPDTVFEAFFTTKENGMGMGLAICRSIVQAHNGRLWAASGEGPGATFCFTLPLQLSPVSRLPTIPLSSLWMMTIAYAKLCPA